MDDSILRSHVRKLRYVAEETTHLEITLHTDPVFDTNKEETLSVDEIPDWLAETGRFTPQILPNDVKRLSSLRLILQKDSQHPDTFDPDVVSLPPAAYISLTERCGLSARAIDSASVIGPIFWCNSQNKGPHHSFHMIYQKTDSRMIVAARGFQLLLSRSYRSQTDSSRVTGFYKGMRDSETAANIKHLRESAQESAHPMLLPVIVLSSNIGPRQEKHQRDVRARLCKIETALVSHMSSDGPGIMSLEAINAELMFCHSMVWKNPGASHKVIECMENILQRWDNGHLYATNDINERYLARVAFIRERLRGIESFSYTTLSMIDMQRTALHNLLLHRHNETALQIEHRQQLEAERKFSVNQTWNKNQRTISLLGIFFLPGAFIASIFSTTFFNFQAELGHTVVSDRFWIFWALTLPVTLSVLAVWWIKERFDDARSARAKTDPERTHSKTR